MHKCEVRGIGGRPGRDGDGAEVGRGRGFDPIRRKIDIVIRACGK